MALMSLPLLLQQVRACSISFQKPHIKEALFDKGSEKQSDARHVQTVTVIRRLPGLQASLANGSNSGVSCTDSI